jgi:hypothetical protein
MSICAVCDSSALACRILSILISQSAIGFGAGGCCCTTFAGVVSVLTTVCGVARGIGRAGSGVVGTTGVADGMAVTGRVG